MSEVLSMHDHGNCELCDQLESELALLRRAARALVNDIRTCYPEGLGELGGIGPYVEAIEAELIKEQEGASLAEDR